MIMMSMGIQNTAVTGCQMGVECQTGLEQTGQEARQGSLLVLLKMEIKFAHLNKQS